MSSHVNRWSPGHLSVGRVTVAVLLTAQHAFALCESSAREPVIPLRRGGFNNGRITTARAASRGRTWNGLDAIGLTLDEHGAIRAYEARRREQEPWLFG